MPILSPLRNSVPGRRRRGRSKAALASQILAPAGLEPLEPRLLLTSSPTFVTPLENQVLTIHDAVTIGVDADDVDGDNVVVTAVSDEADLIAFIPQNNRLGVLHVVNGLGAPIGDIVMEVFETRAGDIAAQFIGLAEGNFDANGDLIPGADPFWTSVAIHRVAELQGSGNGGFIVQTGDAVNGNGTGGSNLGDVVDQFNLQNGLSFGAKLVVAMANSGPDTQDSQIFITDDPVTFLNDRHMIIGHVITGHDVVKDIIALYPGGATPADPARVASIDIIANTQDATITFMSVNGFVGEADVTVTLDDLDPTTADTTQTIKVGVLGFDVPDVTTQPGQSVSLDADPHGNPAQTHTVTATGSPSGPPVSVVAGDRVDVDIPADFSGILAVALQAEQNNQPLLNGDGAAFVIAEALDTPAPILGRADTNLRGDAVAQVIDGDHMYVANGTRGIEIFDISDPADPQFLGGFITGGDSRDIEVLDYTGPDRKVAFVADSNGGMLVLDVTAPDNVFQLDRAIVNRFDDTKLQDSVFDVEIDAVNMLAWAAGKTGGLAVFDITDPLNIPDKLDQLGLTSGAPPNQTPLDLREIEIEPDGNFVYGTLFNFGMVVYNWQFINAPEEPRDIDIGFPFNTPLTGAWGMKLVGDLLYIVEQGPGGAGTLSVRDVSDPAVPGLPDEIALSDTPQRLDVDGAIAAVTHLDGNVSFVDVSDPANMTVLHTLDSPTVADPTFFGDKLALPMQLHGVLIVDTVTQIIVEDEGGATVVSSTDPADAIDLGQVRAGGDGPQLKLTIRNDGLRTLDIGAIGLPVGFTLVSDLADRSLDPRETGDFTVQLDAVGLGVMAGNVTIQSNDADDGSFSIPVTGEVTAAQITVLDDGGNSIVSSEDPANAIDVGSVVMNEAGPQFTLTIRNDGSAVLNIGVINLPAGYTLLGDLADRSLDPAQAESFTIRLDSAEAGVKAGLITIANDDADEAPFNVPITGSVSAPEISVLNGLGGNVVSSTDPADAFDFGSVLLNEVVGTTMTYTIVNDGSAILNVTAIGVPTGFILDMDIADRSLDPTQQEVFIVRLDTSVPGVQAGVVTIGSDDADEDPFNISVIGEVTPPAPDIALLDASGDAVVSSLDPLNAIDLGDVLMNLAGPTLTLTIRNDGVVLLNVTDITLPDGFTFAMNIQDPSLDPGQSEAFTVQVDTTEAGVKAGFVRIDSDDPDEPLFSVPVTALVLLPVPEITVEGPGGANITSSFDPTDAIDVGTVALGALGPDLTLSVRNDGTGLLTIADITVPDGYLLVADVADDTLDTGQEVTFTVRLDSADAGVMAGFVRVTSDDADESPFSIPVTGEVIVPQIAVEDAGGSIVVSSDDLADANDLGTAVLADPALTMIWSILNDGTDTLNIASIDVPDGFTLAANVTDSSLAPGQEESFTIGLLTAEAGVFGGVVRINSDDPDDSPFNIPVTGEVTARQLIGVFDSANRLAPFTIDGVEISLSLRGDGQATAFELPDGSVDIEATGTTRKTSLLAKTGGGDGTFDVNLMQTDGSFGNLDLRTGNLVGNVMIAQTAKTIRLADVTDDHLIEIGEPLGPRDAVTISMARVENLDIVSQTGIKSITVDEWIDDNEHEDLITAPWIGKITSAGNFMASMDVSGIGATKQSVGSVKIAGLLAEAVWQVVGDFGTMITGNITDFELNVASVFKSLKAGILTNVNFNLDDAGLLNIAAWNGGGANVSSLKGLSAKGTPQAAGDVADVDLTITGSNNPKVRRAFGGAKIANEWRDSTLTVTGDGGLISANEVSSLTAAFSGDILGLKTKSDAGVDLTASTIKLVSAGRHLHDSTIVATEPFTARGKAINLISAKGMIIDTVVSSSGNITTVKASALHDSRIFAGIGTLDPGQVLPDTANGNDFDALASIKNISIKSSAGTTSFLNSAIAAWNIVRAKLGVVQLANDGNVHGLAADAIGSLSGKDTAGNTFRLSRIDDPAALAGVLGDLGIDLEDFEVRLV